MSFTYSTQFRPAKIYGLREYARPLHEQRGYKLLKAQLDMMPTIAWWSSRDGSDKVFNQRWIAFTGAQLPARKIFNEHSFIHPVDIPSINLAMAELFAEEKTQRLECRLKDAGGIYQRFEARLRADHTCDAIEEGLLVECSPIGGYRNAAY